MAFIHLDSDRYLDALGAAASTAVHLLRSLISESDNRAAFQAEIQGLSQKNLRDVGLTSGDASSLEQLPLTGDSADHLHRVRNERSCNW